MFLSLFPSNIFEYLNRWRTNHFSKMEGYVPAPAYYYPDVNYQELDDDQRICLNIWWQNDKHFRMFCATFNTLSDLMDDFTDIIEEPAKNYDFIVNRHVVDKEAKLRSLIGYGFLGTINIVAIKKPDTSDECPKRIKYVECMVQCGITFFSTGFDTSKTLEDYEAVIRYKLAIRKLKHYYFVDYQDHPINPKHTIGSIPSCGPIRIIKIKNRQSFVEQINELSKKTQELLEQAPKDETN